MKIFTYKNKLDDGEDKECIVLLSKIVGIIESSDNAKETYIILEGARFWLSCSEKYIDVKERWKKALAVGVA